MEEKETPWRHRPETERYQMRRKREDLAHKRGITRGTPTTHARTNPRHVTQSRCNEFAVSQFVGTASMCTRQLALEDVTCFRPRNVRAVGVA